MSQCWTEKADNRYHRRKFGAYLAQFFSYPNITMVKMGESDNRSLDYATTGPVKAIIQGLAM